MFLAEDKMQPSISFKCINKTFQPKLHFSYPDYFIVFATWNHNMRSQLLPHFPFLTSTQHYVTRNASLGFPSWPGLHLITRLLHGNARRLDARLMGWLHKEKTPFSHRVSNLNLIYLHTSIRVCVKSNYHYYVSGDTPLLLQLMICKHKNSDEVVFWLGIGCRVN